MKVEYEEVHVSEHAELPEHPELILGNFEYVDALEEVGIYLEHVSNGQTDLEEIKEQCDINQNQITNIRKSLDPLIDETVENYSPVYEPTELGIRVLGHLTNVIKELDENIDDENFQDQEFGDKQEDNGVDWSQTI